MEQVTLTVNKIGSAVVDSEERIFNAAQMNSVRNVGGNAVFEYPLMDRDGLLKHQTVIVDETFAEVQTAIGVADAVGTGEAIALTATGAQAVTVRSRFTEIDGVTNQASGNRTIDLTINASTPKGAQLLVKVKTAGTQTTTFGTGIDAPVITGEAGKTFTQLFVYNGTIFLPAGAAVKID